MCLKKKNSYFTAASKICIVLFHIYANEKNSTSLVLVIHNHNMVKGAKDDQFQRLIIVFEIGLEIDEKVTVTKFNNLIENMSRI